MCYTIISSRNNIYPSKLKVVLLYFLQNSRDIKESSLNKLLNPSLSPTVLTKGSISEILNFEDFLPSGHLRFFLLIFLILKNKTEEKAKGGLVLEVSGRDV